MFDPIVKPYKTNTHNNTHTYMLVVPHVTSALLYNLVIVSML